MNERHIPDNFRFIVIIIIELTHCKNILENTVEIEPQPVALDFKNLFLSLFSNLHSEAKPNTDHFLLL